MLFRSNAVAAATPAHAYLFTGPRGTGKTSTGRILAKAVNCLAPAAGEPCNACVSCQAFSEGRALDLIELDAASNRGIDEVRALREAAGYAPNSARFKVYLPASESAQVAPIVSTRPDLPRGNGELILVVDDEHSIREVAKETLRTFGYRVLTANDGTEALALYAQHTSEIRIVLTDKIGRAHV